MIKIWALLCSKILVDTCWSTCIHQQVSTCLNTCWFHSYIEKFSSSLPIFLVFNTFYCLPVNRSSSIKEFKSHLKITFIYCLSNKGIRRRVLSYMSCFLGTHYFWWLENEHFKEWFWRHLFLLGFVAKSKHSQLKIYQICQQV